VGDWGSRYAPAFDNPLGRLAGHPGDDVVIAIVVQDCQPCRFGGRSDDQIGDGDTMMPDRARAAWMVSARFKVGSAIGIV
jgi:hypothetical protein